MKKLIFLLVFCALALSSVWAQKTFSGTVLGPDGLGLPGVNVVEKGNTINGASTDIDGKWTLTVPSEKSILEFTSIGMKTVEMAAKNAAKITMKSDAQVLDEVMVVAYGTAKKSTFTGSASTVKSDELEKKTVESVGQALDGLASGVQVSSGSGQPGSSPSIRIRGIGSINSSSEPLYVIDGVARFADNIGGASSSSLSALANLNPNDIANVTILKDAAAAALYGSRAANGVVLITTKRGREGKTQFSIKAEAGVSDFAVETLPLASPKEAYEYKLASVINRLKDYEASYKGATDAQILKDATEIMKENFPNYDPNRPDSDYDWYNELFQQGKRKNVEFSARGGGEKTKFFISMGYLDVKGVAVGSSFKRVSGRLNLDHKENKYLEFGSSTYISKLKQRVIPTKGYYYVNPLYATHSFLNQLTPIRDTKGRYGKVEKDKKPNLVKENDLNSKTNNVWTINQQGYVKVNLIEGLSFKSTNSLDFTNLYYSDYMSPLSSDGKSYNGYAEEKNKRRIKLSTSNIVTYNKSIQEDHNINFLAGYEAEQLRDQELSTSGKDFPNGSSKTLDVAAKPLSAYYGYDGDRMQSILSRFNYNYDNKYYASASVRTDASSRLGKDNRWGTFWSLSGSWRIKSEDFMQDLTVFNDLKLRASYGSNGTLPFDWAGSLYLDSFGNDYNNIPGTAYTQLGNKDLSWEKNNTLSIALEGKVLDNRIGFELEYFSKKTTDLLLEVPISRTTGFSSYWDNVGEMTNTGVEFTLNTLNINNELFKWNTTLTLSHYKNVIDKLQGGDNVDGFPYILREGKSYGSIYLRDWAGVNPKNGHAQWYILENEKRVDKNKDGKYDVTENSRAAGKRIVGDGLPDLTGSLNNTIKISDFDFSFLFTFKIGGDAYIGPHSSIFDDGANLSKAVTKEQLNNYWTKEGQAAKYPQPVWTNPQHSHYNSSRRIEDASFLRLKSVNLGYNIPTKWCNKIGANNVRLYLSGSNLLTFSKITDFDPETTQRGTVLNNFDFTPMKTINFGLQVNF